MKLIKVRNPSFDAECIILPSETHDCVQELPQDFNPYQYDAVLLEGYDDEKKTTKTK